MDKAEILNKLRDLNATFDVDGEIIDFAYAASETIEEILEDE